MTTIRNTLLSCAALALLGCGSDDATSPNSGTVVLRDITLTFTAAEACSAGGLDTDFLGESGTTVTIQAAGGANLRPQFTLYAPDFATQLAGSTPNGNGRARLVHALTQSGTHYVTLCDGVGATGNVRVTVTRPILQ